MPEYRIAYTISVDDPDLKPNPRVREARWVYAATSKEAVQKVLDDCRSRGLILHSQHIGQCREG